MKVVVVGGGIAGLAVAGGLQRAGWQTVVLERSAGPQQACAGLSVFGNGFRALDALGLGPAVAGITADEPPYQQSGIRNPGGRWLVKFGAAAVRNLRCVDRTELHGVLLAAVGAGSVQWGRRVSAVRDGGIEFDDGTTMDATDADLIIGADGIRSQVRAGLPQSSPTRRCGYGVWRAVTSRPVPLDVGGETWGPGMRFGIVPMRDDRVYWFAVVAEAQHETGAGALEEIRARFGSWHDPITEVIDATQPDAVTYLPVEDLARPLPSYVHDRTVLIGDAAHAMTPNLGQGANQALEDAATLTALLTAGPAQGAPDLQARLRRYDRLRRPRTQKVARESRGIGVTAQWSHRLPVWVRETGMSLVPDRVFNHRTIRLQDWKPDSAAVGGPLG